MNAESAPANRIDVRYVANLARLALTEEEVATFQGQLGQIVDYVQAIDRLDVTGIEPTSHAHLQQNVFRSDVARPSLDQASVLRNAPASRDGLLLVPKIVE
ncbi:MAG: Asp-tRNA(Asn)/Glu-tRNA(Gln) amidotransferase subunit GatC [Verrucomicrobia bacterium]|nr:Asp-tRNA(Asn)/Glu-tRNA(Gln) amidotransferase subunit GatC [Verrucomicrobiota bacterium]